MQSVLVVVDLVGGKDLTRVGFSDDEDVVEVVRLARSVVGNQVDLPWQAITGATLARYAPPAVLRLAHRANHEHKRVIPRESL